MTKKAFFTDEEYQHLMLLAIKACGPAGASDEQILDFVKLCERMRFDGMAVEALLSGNVEVTSFTKNGFSVRYVPENTLTSGCKVTPANLAKILARHQTTP